MENWYKPGLLLEARRDVLGFILGQNVKGKTKYTKTIIKYKTMVILLEYCRDYRSEDICVLLNNKKIYVMDIDLEHDFKILTADNT